MFYPDVEAMMMPERSNEILVDVAADELLSRTLAQHTSDRRADHLCISHHVVLTWRTEQGVEMSNEEILQLGAGGDTLIGGGGADVFRFSSISDVQGDLVSDFQRGSNRIDLAGVDAVTDGSDNAFNFIGGAAFSHVAGQLRAYVASGSTYVEGDVNGDGAADFSLRLPDVFSLQSGDSCFEWKGRVSPRV
jgi:hypothetical protein